MSLSVNPVNWFEIPVTDLGRATKFYESIFGIQLSLQHPYMQVDEVGTSLVGSPMEMAWFPMERNAPNAAGTLMKSKGYTPSHQGTQIYFSVDDIEDVLRKVDQSGGKTFAHLASFDACPGLAVKTSRIINMFVSPLSPKLMS